MTPNDVLCLLEAHCCESQENVALHEWGRKSRKITNSKFCTKSTIFDRNVESMFETIKNNS